MFPQWTIWTVVMWNLLALGSRLTPGWGMNTVAEIKKLVLMLAAIFAAATSYVFLTKAADETSRLTLGLSFAFSLLLCPLLRTITKRFLMHFRIWGMQVVLYGNREEVRTLIDILHESAEIGYTPVGAYLMDQGPGTGIISGVPILTPSEDPYVFADTAILVEPKKIEQIQPHFTEQKLHQYRRVLLVPELNHDAPSLWITPRDLGGVVGTEVSSNLLDPLARSFKIAFDLVTVTLTAPILFPVLGVMALLIWLLDFQNPFFLQQRIGQEGVPFQMWKFRTMRPHAEELLQRKLAADELFREQWNDGCKIKNDPRITRLGSWLRRTSLDELPQLFNVFQGSMSLIGPRPLPLYHEQQLPERVRDLRRRVRPGMTGLWQISGRSETGNDGIVRWDSYYVRNWSIWLDLVILTRTASVVLRGKGAY